MSLLKRIFGKMDHDEKEAKREEVRTVIERTERVERRFFVDDVFPPQKKPVAQPRRVWND